MKVEFQTASFSFYAELNDTPAAKEIVDYLPITSTVSRWGDEIYFDAGVKLSAEDSSMDVEVGDVAYWSQGKSICVFFGPTPASEDGRPYPASPVAVIGKTSASCEELRRIVLGEEITLSQQE